MPGAAALLAGPAPPTSPAFAAFSRAGFPASPSRLPLPSPRSRRLPLRAQQSDEDYIAYDEKKSVFPAEACEDLGGESCEADGVGPEVKGSAAAAKQAAASKGENGVDREYIDYKEIKTVFPGEACDDLGGEFCEPEYQTGVYPEKTGAKK